MTGPLLLPPSILLIPAVQSPTVGAADERRFKHSYQYELYFTTHSWPPLCSPLLPNFYFGSRTSAGASGNEDEPLIERDVSTLSPYGAWNSTELLSNLHNMLRI